jgi:hypothetical protein
MMIMMVRLRITLLKINKTFITGIDILPVNETLACDPKSQLLIVKQQYGYINTPNFDRFHYYPSNLSCSWTLIAEINHIFLIRFVSLELDYEYKDGLYLYDGQNSSGVLIERYSGTSSIEAQSYQRCL